MLMALLNVLVRLTRIDVPEIRRLSLFLTTANPEVVSGTMKEIKGTG